MSLLAIRFAAEPVRSIAFGGIGGTYAAVGGPLVNPIRQFLLQNETDALLMFSIDGVNDHFTMPAGSNWINDLNSNRSLQAQGWFIANGTTLYVKNIGSPSTGSVYFSVFYGQDSL